MTRAEMLEVVTRNLVAVVEDAEGREIVESASLADYDADSLEIVEVVSRSMKQLKLKVRRVDLADAENISDLLDLFEKAQAAK